MQAFRTPRYLTRLAASLGLGLLITACATTLRPDVDYKPDYDFSQVQTIGFYADSGTVSGDNPLQLSDMQVERIDTAVRNALTAKGLRFTEDAAEADLLVSWHLVTQFKTDVDSYDAGFSAGWYQGYNRYSLYNCWGCIGPRTEVISRNYTDGTFIVDMIDPTLERSVWRGVVNSRLSGKQIEDQERANRAAEAIFAAFPPGAAAGTSPDPS